MTAAPTAPYDWIKEIPTALLQLDEIPLLGYPPQFPWKEFAQKLANQLEIKNLEIKPHDVEWRQAADLYTGVGSHPIALQFTIPSLEGKLCWIWAERDIHLLMSLLLSNQTKPIEVIDHEFQKGFIHFLAYEICYVLNDIPFDKTLTPHILDQEELPDEASLCLDVSIVVNDQPFLGRLIISPDFRQSWKERYATRNMEVPLHPELAEKIQIPVHLEAGRTSLKLSEWKKIKAGDFLVLDFCSLHPDEDKGRVMMTVNGLPFFRARLKQGSLKILEHPLYQEEEASMPKNPDEDFNESELEDSSFDLDHDSEHEDFDFDDELTDLDHDEESIDLKEDSSKENVVKESTPATDSLPPKKLPLNPEDLPLSVVVEIGRIQMSIKSLMELQPGNMLDLNMRPENGVDLVVNGKRIGKGELLRLGETLGIRILDIG